MKKSRYVYQVLSRLAGTNELKAYGQVYFNDSDSATAYIYGQIAKSQQFNQFMLGDVEYVIVRSLVIFKQDFQKARGTDFE